MTQITGTIKKIFETKQISEKFSKRDIVITTNDMYPQDVIMQFTQDKCSILDSYKENQQVVVDINIRGREWISPTNEVKYFNTLEAWKINHDSQSPGVPGEQTSSGIPEAPTKTEQDDDLPF